MNRSITHRLFVLVLVALSCCALLSACDSDGGSENCKTGCEHIQACRISGFADADLQQSPDYATQEACEAACAEHASSESAACAARTTDCAALDDVCDVY